MTRYATTWKRLIDVKPTRGQLVEYYGAYTKKPTKGYRQITTTPRKGRFMEDCGTSWTENLGGFTTETLGVIVAPDPATTFWRDAENNALA